MPRPYERGKRRKDYDQRAVHVSSLGALKVILGLFLFLIGRGDQEAKKREKTQCGEGETMVFSLSVPLFPPLHYDVFLFF